MAASAAYIKIAHVRRGDGKTTLDAPVTFSNIGSTTAAFTLSGGTYAIDTLFTGSGSVTLQVLGGDGSTYINVVAVSTSGTHSGIDLGAGTYKLALA